MPIATPPLPDESPAFLYDVTVMFIGSHRTNIVKNDLPLVGVMLFFESFDYIDTTPVSLMLAPTVNTVSMLGVYDKQSVTIIINRKFPTP